MRRVLPLLLAFTVLSTARAQGTPIGFEERFALATDRAAVLAELIPGTDDYYYYHCLHAQHSGDWAEVERLLPIWIERHGRNARVVEVENRQALLRFDENPGATFDFLRERLALRFDAQRRSSTEEPDLPTRLDPARISGETLTRRALARHPGSLDGFRDSALRSLAASDLSDEQLMNLMQRLERPDVPNLPALVVRNLRHPRSRGFGSLDIHASLLLDQLEELVRLQPPLLDDPEFVGTYLRRLRPSPDVQWRQHADARERYLDRLWSFAQRLGPVHNSLKAHVLYHRLVHDLATGAPDKERFMAYLRLPRPGQYVNPVFLRRARGAGEVADLSRGFPTEMAAVGSTDEPLVRAYLQRYFRDEASIEPYADYVQRDYLRRLFAETKILAGEGDMERWYSMLDDPTYYEALKERVEIDFPPTQRSDYAVGEPVSIEVDFKNVDTLIVKVFEIDTFDFHREQGRDVDLSIDLDGLVANSERTFTYDDNPLRRVRRRFDLPSLEGAGTWVVELIGNGLSSRALIRKGRLQLVERIGSAGHVFRVLDEQGAFVDSATIWFAGREYRPDERGEIVVPFSTDPGAKKVVLRAGRLSTLEQFRHHREAYGLEAGIYVDREALLAGRNAEVVVRPRLTVAGVPVSLELLEEPELSIEAVDLDGVSSTLSVRDLELSSERDLVHEIRVPDRLAELKIVLRARVRSLSDAEDVRLASAEASFAVNGIDATAETASPLLGRTASGYVLDVLGKNGEPRAAHAVQLRLVHRDFTDSIDVKLQTDARGRIELGALEGITRLSAAALPDDVGAWSLDTEARTYPGRVCGTAGETLRVPMQRKASATSRSAVSLLELRGGAFARDAFDHVRAVPGFVELRDLPPGDYDLWLRGPQRHVEIRITDGEMRGGWAIGRDRLLELEDRTELQITGVEAVDGELRVQLANVGADARVHVFATRYLAAFDPFDGVRVSGGPGAQLQLVHHAESYYDAGREIGDEYRYILERRFAKKFPGNMLDRPGLLLNPWALEETETALGLGGGAGGRAQGRGGGRRYGGPAAGAEGGAWRGLDPGAFANLGFLPEPSRVLANLRPGEDGVLRVPLAELGEGRLVHVVAVDLDDTVYGSLALAEQPLEPRSQRLADGLDPQRHFTEQKGIEFVEAGGQAVIDDVTTAEFDTYDSLADVFRLFRTLSSDQSLNDFAFVLRWPQLSAEEKRELYSKHACHELHFFVYMKDRSFFDEVLRPYLENKAHKTFLDHWLLGDDLAGYLEPWAFERLNVAERILLTKRLAEESEAGARHVRELLELEPPDLDRIGYLVGAVLKSGALDTRRGPAGPTTPGRAPREDRPAAPAPDPAAKPKSEDKKDRELAEAEVMEKAAPEPVELARALDDDFARRKNVRQLYRAPERTREYVEQNYYRVRIEDQDADLIEVNAFWRDFAEAAEGEPFCSTNVAAAAGNFAEMMLALAVLDLPFEAGETDTARDGDRLTMRAATPMLLVRKAIREVQSASAESPILISQNFYRLDDRYRYEGNERLDKFVTDEFLVDVAYGCQVVLTNPTSSPRTLELLLQIPRGATPVQRGFYTRGVGLRLEPFATRSIEYAFYFADPGSYRHYPAHVARDGELVAFAEPATLEVLVEPSKVDTTSWEHVSQDGSVDEVLAFLEDHNVQRLDLTKIAWRMRDRGFFDTVIERLRRRHAYVHELWSYGIHHGDASVTRGYLRHANDFVARCGPALSSPILTIDPIERRAYQHIEYAPLFNARAHRFGRRREILNSALAEQYLALMSILAHRRELDAIDWLSVTYYLLLQDRIEDALAGFDRVDAARLPTRLQYDYMRAYLDFFSDDHRLARGIAEEYRDHPVTRWRARFRDVLNQLDEAEGAAVAVSDPGDRTQQQTALAATEPALELVVEAGRITVRHANLERCEIGYYEMDVELSFSTNPFVQQESGSFAYVRPNRSDTVSLGEDRAETSWELPAEFQSSNVLVEVSGGGITRRQAYFANSLAIRTMATYGQLEVAEAETGKRLPRTYVKVYARTPTGDVRFHKDGYTDLRGRFDYASVSGEGAAEAERFAILVLSESDGAVIREVAPPGR